MLRPVEWDVVVELNEQNGKKKTVVEWDEVFFSREHVFDSVFRCFFYCI
jgi:hypothetical protein